VTSDPTARGQGDGEAPERIAVAELVGVLRPALAEVVDRLKAVAAVVYLVNEDRSELWAAMIGGGLPSVYTLPGRMALDSPHASAQALASGEVRVQADPGMRSESGSHIIPYPYAIASAPLLATHHRFGALTVLRLETEGGYDEADGVQLEEAGAELAAALVALAERGTAIVPGHMPVVVPMFRSAPVAGASAAPGWGAPGVPGSAALSFMYPLRRLADLLNQATTMEHVVAAARFCIMEPFQARALALASVGEGRLWVLGHSGDSSRIVQYLHGSSVHARTPAAEAVLGSPLCMYSDPGAADPDRPDDVPNATVYLPLTSGRHLFDPPVTGGRHIVGVCSLSFTGARSFPPDVRAVLTMMAGLLGSAVERVELSAKRHALAESVQKWLLPHMLPELPQLTTTARYWPATATAEVGGDWYDVIELPGDRVVLAVGDVEGHAIESAALMGQLRSAVVAYATEGHRPAAIIDRTAALLAHLGTDLLATCCVVLMDAADGVVEVALAGHPEPLVQRPDGSVGALDAPVNVPLGVAAPTPYRAREHTVEPGSVLMLYTDGLTDWRAPDPAAGARALLEAGSREAASNLENLADHLVAEVPGPQQRRDDAVLLLARYEGARGEGAPRTGRLHIQRHDLHGVKKARSFVADLLDCWGLATMSDDLQLVTSEVVTNALVHAGSDVDVRLRAFTDYVRLDVRDSDSNPPVPSSFSLSEEGSSQAEHGRGLFLVEALARAWNTSPNGRGKTVWLELAVPGA